jgi:glutathione S-transferase
MMLGKRFVSIASKPSPLHRVRLLAAQFTAATVDADPFPVPNPGQLIVYGIPTSRVVKTLWIAAECNQKVERVPMFQERHLPWALALNPKGTVPSFKDGPLVLNESNTIISYIAQKYGDSNLYPSSPEKLALAWNWLEWGETTLYPAQVDLYFGVVRKVYYPNYGLQKKEGVPTRTYLEPFVADLVAAYTDLDAHFADGRPYILGDSFSIADVSAITAQRCFRNDGFGFEELAPNRFPNIIAWLDRMDERPAYAKLVSP